MRDMKGNQLGEHKGWPNYETWCVNAWLTCNDEATYKRFLDIIQNKDFLTDQAETVERWVRHIVDGDGEDLWDFSGLYTDLLRCAFDMVDFRQIIASNRWAA